MLSNVILSVANNPFMLSVILLNVVMLSVVVPVCSHYGLYVHVVSHPYSSMKMMFMLNHGNIIAMI